jgi:hypothetical protein
MIICYGLDTYRATPDRHHYSERTVLFYFPPFAIAPLRSDLNSNIIESNKIQEQLLFYYEQPSHKPQHPLTIFNPFWASASFLLNKRQSQKSQDLRKRYSYYL